MKAAKEVSGKLPLLFFAVLTLREKEDRGGKFYISLTALRVPVTSSYTILLHPS